MHHLIATFLPLKLLQFFTENRDIDGWEDTAGSWLMAAFVIAALCAGLMFIYKWLRKRTAGRIIDQGWTRGETMILILSGLIPVFLAVCVLWYVSRDYSNIVGVGGLIKGIVFAWILYLIFMFAGHVLSPWRREIL